MTAPEPAGAENRSATAGSLSGTKSVLHRSLAIVGLEGALHGNLLVSQREMAAEDGNRQECRFPVVDVTGSARHSAAAASGDRGDMMAHLTAHEVYRHHTRASWNQQTARLEPFSQGSNLFHKSSGKDS